MNHVKKKPPGARETARKGPASGLVIALSVAAGIVIGSTGTYVLTRPAPVTATPPAVAVGGGAPLMQAAPAQPPGQYTPAPQPPGEVPPGKVWSVEHGHWHDAPTTITPAGIPAVPGFTPAGSAPAAVPAPAVPAEKKP